MPDNGIQDRHKTHDPQVLKDAARMLERAARECRNMATDLEQDTAKSFQDYTRRLSEMNANIDAAAARLR